MILAFSNDLRTHSLTLGARFPEGCKGAADGPIRIRFELCARNRNSRHGVPVSPSRRDAGLSPRVERSATRGQRCAKGCLPLISSRPARGEGVVLKDSPVLASSAPAGAKRPWKSVHHRRPFHGLRCAPPVATTHGPVGAEECGARISNRIRISSVLWINPWVARRSPGVANGQRLQACRGPAGNPQASVRHSLNPQHPAQRDSQFVGHLHHAEA